MGLIQLASGRSAWRGYEYYKVGKVRTHGKVSETCYTGTVAGSDGHSYAVEIDTAHPRSSKCNCPHADGKRIVCKHMVALYFTVFPKEAEDYYNEVVEAQKEEEERQENMENALIDYVNGMKKSELQDTLLQLLLEGPEWQLEQFMQDHLDEEDWE